MPTQYQVRVMPEKRTVHIIRNARVSERIKTWQSAKGRYVSVHSVLLRAGCSGLLLRRAVKVITAFAEIFERFAVLDLSQFLRASGSFRSSNAFITPILCQFSIISLFRQLLPFNLESLYAYPRT